MFKLIDCKIQSNEWLLSELSSHHHPAWSHSSAFLQLNHEQGPRRKSPKQNKKHIRSSSSQQFTWSAIIAFPMWTVHIFLIKHQNVSCIFYIKHQEHSSCSTLTAFPITHARLIRHIARIRTTRRNSTYAAFLAAAIPSVRVMGCAAADVLTTHQSLEHPVGSFGGWAFSDTFGERIAFGYENCEWAETLAEADRFGGGHGEDGEDC